MTQTLNSLHLTTFERKLVKTTGCITPALNLLAISLTRLNNSLPQFLHLQNEDNSIYIILAHKVLRKHLITITFYYCCFIVLEYGLCSEIVVQ